MFKFLFFIFFLFILLLFLMGFSVIRGIKHFLFGSGESNRPKNNHGRGSGRSSGSAAQGYTSRQYRDEVMNDSYRSRRKVYKQDEGEYVDYEEVKD